MTVYLLRNKRTGKLYCRYRQRCPAIWTTIQGPAGVKSHGGSWEIIKRELEI